VSLVDNTLFGMVDKVAVAIERLRQFCPPEGYFLAYSGGKDSTVLLELARRSGVKFDAHYHATTIDPPELVRFVRQQPDVTIDWPKKPFLARLVEKGMPLRHRRWCCAEYKEVGGAGRIIATGIRAAESARRKNRRMVEACISDKSKRYLHPVIDWTDADVWEFIKGDNLAYCSLYDEGFKRLGCVLCPMAGPAMHLREAHRWPKIAAAFRRAFVRLYEKNREREAYRKWPDGSAMFDWWMSNTHAPNMDQMPLDYDDDAVGIYDDGEAPSTAR
jgi:phosphoadenosine phosphosulfate reductase